MSYDSTTRRIVAPVSIRDVQRCFGMSSTDLGTLVRSNSVNIWARYKPIPCLIQNANNTPKPLTDLQRAAENYGLEIQDIYYAAGDGVDVWETYANNLDLSNPHAGATARAWANGMYYRLSDFAKCDSNRAPVANVGYDANAMPATVIVTVGGTDFTVQPTIPVGQRVINVAVNGVFEFPRDSFWMPTYYGIMTGTISPSASNKVTLGNPEWLSILDFISGARFSVIVDATKVRHGLVIFKPEWNDTLGDYEWKFVCKIRDRDETSGNVATRSFAQHPEAFADFTDTSTTDVGSPSLVSNLSELSGEYLFIDYWQLTYSNSAGEQQPIIGFAYEVTINRSSTIYSVDVANVLAFTKIEAQSSIDDNTTAILFYFDYNPEITGISGGLADDPPNYPARTAILNLLQQHYSYLVITVGGVQFNLLNASTIIESYTDTSHDEEHGWTSTFRAYGVIFDGTYLDAGLTATITAVRNDIAYSGTLTKSVPVV